MTMNFEEQNQLAESLTEIISTKLSKKEFHAIIAIEDKGECFTFAISSLAENSFFHSCKLIVKGIGEEAQLLVEKFKIPPDEKIKRPVEPK